MLKIKLQEEECMTSCRESCFTLCLLRNITTFSVWKVSILMTWWCNDLKEVKQNIVWNTARFPEFQINCIIYLNT